MIPSDLDILARPVAHLPFVRAVVDQLGILEAIDERCPKHPLNRVSDSQCVLALVLNVLCGRPALYRMDEWLGRLDVDVLFGNGTLADAFNDTRLAEALDHLDDAGTDTILADIVRAYLAEEGESRAFSVHHDTTSVTLEGAYETGDVEPRPARGYSKDHRPDLKQLIYGLTLHGSVGMPLVSTVTAGNTSDPAVARDHLARLVDVLPEEHEVTFVGDCKLVDARTVGRLLRAGLHFVSLLPDTYNLRQELIADALATRPDVADWPLLAEKAGRKKDDPLTAYRGASVTRPFRTLLEDSDGDGPESIEDMRFLVVWSDALATRFDEALEPKRLRDEEKLQEAARRANGRGFSCETDARASADRVVAKAEFHAAQIELITEEVAVKRSGPGRPRTGDARETRSVFRFKLTFSRDDTVIAATRRRRSCFVLVSNWSTDEWEDTKVLAEYRHQHIIEGHTGFRWLKGPAAVAPVFLKTPQRIRAMGLVLILALMVRNYIQATLRSELAAREQTIPHPFTKQPQANLTPEMAFEHFGGVLTQVVTLGEHSRRMPIQLRAPALQILDLFAMDVTIFAPPTVPARKWRRVRRETPGM